MGGDGIINFMNTKTDRRIAWVPLLACPAVPQKKLLYKPAVAPMVVALAAGLCLLSAAVATAMDYVTLRRDGRDLQLEGRVEVTAQDGGILLLARDGVLWTILPEELGKHSHDDTPFRPLSTQDLSRLLLARLPKGFDVHPTTHYLIFHNTSRVYAQWCGGLFERLYTAFRNYWTHKGFELAEPEFPLVAVVFADKSSYVKFSRAELGDAAESIIGYFSLASNRMTMYDLTESSGRGNRFNSSAQLNQVLGGAQAVQTVATVVHEAMHQIAFNCGLHTRFSDCPLWFSEGIAVYFETPDLHSTKGWSGVGAVNRMRLVQFQQFLRSRPRDSLTTLIRDDKRFHDLKQVLDTYSEAWALTYYLIRQRPKQYVEYLRLLSAKKPVVQDTPQARLDQFERCFGSLKQVDADFLRYMLRVR